MPSDNLSRHYQSMAKAASDNELKAAFEEHLGVIATHVARLETIFETMDKAAPRKSGLHPAERPNPLA
jgi:ferritin-like metal-binding protein YciE